MKYIRTRDGHIYKVRDPLPEEYIWDNATYVYGHEHIKNEDIVARADTIEELCDRFVIYCKPNYYEVHEDFEEVKDWFYAENVTAIFGAIWTIKGLIHVAKLNNKGELELL